MEVDTHHKRNNLDHLQLKVYVAVDRYIDVVFCIRLSTNLALYLQVMIYVIYMLVVFSFIFRKLLSINISILRHICIGVDKGETMLVYKVLKIVIFSFKEAKAVFDLINFV